LCSFARLRRFTVIATPNTERAPRFAPGSFLWLVYAIAFLIVLIDGYDAQAVSFAAAALRQEIGVDQSALGALFSAGLFGVGRFGGVAGPALAGMLLAQGLSFEHFMMAVGAVSTAAGCGVFALSLAAPRPRRLAHAGCAV
jgi:hypothetical protein